MSTIDIDRHTRKIIFDRGFRPYVIITYSPRDTTRSALMATVIHSVPLSSDILLLSPAATSFVCAELGYCPPRSSDSFQRFGGACKKLALTPSKMQKIGAKTVEDPALVPKRGGIHRLQIKSAQTWLENPSYSIILIPGTRYLVVLCWFGNTTPSSILSMSNPNPPNSQSDSKIGVT